MARFLALDLDQRQVRMLAVNAGRAAGRIEQALTVTFPEDLTPSSGEALGKSLPDQARAAGLTLAPILASIGRDRVVVKEVRFPPVPVHEEPALVRFQASKEMAEAASEVVIDYFLMSDRKAPGQRQAVVVILKREVMQALEALARGLGVRLAGVTPRPLALAAAYERARGAQPAGEAAAIVNVNERWAELCILRGDKPRFSRSLATSAALMQEVRRNLTLYAAQEGESANLPQVLYLGGQPKPEVCESWRAAVGLKVEGLDPFKPEDKGVPAEERGVYLAAAGLAHLARAFSELPINFAKPKEGTKAPREGQRQRVLLAAVGAAAFVILCIAGVLYVNYRRAALEDLQLDEQGIDAKLQKYALDKPTVDALKDWDAGTISWADELYDISAAFPHAAKLRVKQFNAVVLPRKGSEDKFAGRMNLDVFAPSDKTKLVYDFLDAMNASPRGDAKAKKDERVHAVRSSSKPAAEKGIEEFQIKIDVARERPPDFRAVLTVPKAPPPSKKAAPMPEEWDEGEDLP